MVGSQQEVICTLEEKETLLLKRLFEYEETFRGQSAQQQQPPPRTASSLHSTSGYHSDPQYYEQQQRGATEAQLAELRHREDIETLTQECIESITGSGELQALLGGAEVTPQQASQIALKLLEHYAARMGSAHVPLLALLAQNSIAQHILAPGFAQRMSDASSGSSLVRVGSGLSGAASNSSVGVQRRAQASTGSLTKPGPVSRERRAPVGVWDEEQFGWFKEETPVVRGSTLERLQAVEERSRQILAHV